MRPRSCIILAVAVPTALCLLIWIFVRAEHARNAPHRAALLRIFRAVNLGDSEKSAAATIQRLKTPEIRVGQQDKELWRVSTPLDFGAMGWQLIVEIRSGKVTAVRLRTLDGPPPLDAPPDKSIN